MTPETVAAGALLLTLWSLIPRALRWAEKPRGDWSSQTYGDDVSYLDALDFEHRPYKPQP